MVAVLALGVAALAGAADAQKASPPARKPAPSAVPPAPVVAPKAVVKRPSLPPRPPAKAEKIPPRHAVRPPDKKPVAQIALPARKPAAPTASPKPPVKKAAKQGSPTQEGRCAALNACREDFSNCRFANQEKGPDGWEIHKEACAKKYQACVDKAFPEGGMTFTRWFLPFDACK